MSDEDGSRDWFRRRRSSFSRDWGFRDIDNIFHEMERMMEEAFKDFNPRVPRDFVRERRLPDGSTEREFGPFVHGYSVKIGPDGKPEVTEFGNVKQTRGGPQVTEEREPLVDVVDTNGEVQVVVELPGVEKEDIELHGTEDTLTISVNVPQRKYYKEIKLPARVKVNEAKTAYRNGVLEVTLPKGRFEKKPKGEPIRID